jgi:zinc protease
MSEPTEITLQNGLKVMLKEIHTAPLISQWLWYRVGSRDETPGATGLSHWVEHMQFKGTSRFPSNMMERSIARKGGVWNAFTYMDWTTYYATLPANQIDQIMEFEADRMVNSPFLPEEVESERTVIIAELEGSENDPTFRLSQAMQKECFKKHPYRVEVIGEKEDLQRITRDELYAHYQRMYAPNNAVLALAGDFDTQEMLTKITELYAHIPAGDVPTRTTVVEPPITSEVRMEDTGPGDTTFMEISYRSLPAAHPDNYALTVLGSLLNGPSNMNMFGGGGVSNKTSRLYRAVIDTGLAVGVGGGAPTSIDPFTYSFSITAHPDQPVETALQALDDEIARLQNDLVSMDEIHRAIKQAHAMFAFGSENITNQAFWLGHAEMFANYNWFETFLQRLSEVTPRDVQRIAQTLFIPNSRVIGIYRPNGKPTEEEGEW